MTDDEDLLEGISLFKVSSTAERNRATHRKLDNDELGLDELISQSRDKREWIEDAAVILIHEQECQGCGSRHTWSHGWFTGSHHARDPSGYQLTAGKPIGYFPTKVQRVETRPVPVCGCCAESQRLIERATRG